MVKSSPSAVCLTKGAAHTSKRAPSYAAGATLIANDLKRHHFDTVRASPPGRPNPGRQEDDGRPKLTFFHKEMCASLRRLTCTQGFGNESQSRIVRGGRLFENEFVILLSVCCSRKTSGRRSSHFRLTADTFVRFGGEALA